MSNNKSAAGRPLLPPEQTSSRHLHIRITIAEEEVLRRAAEHGKTTVSGIIRGLISGLKKT